MWVASARIQLLTYKLTICVNWPTLYHSYQNTSQSVQACLSNELTETGISTSLKSNFYFRFHSPFNTKSALPNFMCRPTWDLVLICWKMCSSEPENCRNRNTHTSKIKSANYFRIVSQTIGVDATTFLSRMQNSVKIGKNCGRNT